MDQLLTGYGGPVTAVCASSGLEERPVAGDGDATTAALVPRRTAPKAGDARTQTLGDLALHGCTRPSKECAQGLGKVESKCD